MPFGVSHTLYRPRSVSDNKFSLLQRRLKSSTPPRCSRNCSLRGEEEGSRMFAGLDGRSLHCDFGTLRCVGNTGRWWFCRNICLAGQGRAGQGRESLEWMDVGPPLLSPLWPVGCSSRPAAIKKNETTKSVLRAPARTFGTCCCCWSSVWSTDTSTLHESGSGCGAVHVPDTGSVCSVWIQSDYYYVFRSFARVQKCLAQACLRLRHPRQPENNPDLYVTVLFGSNFFLYVLIIRRQRNRSQSFLIRIRQLYSYYS